MSRPIAEQMRPVQSQPNNDVISEVIAMAQNGANMQNELQNRLNRDPQKAQEFAQFMQQNRGRNVWDIAYDLMRQRGINPAMYGLPPRN